MEKLDNIFSKIKEILEEHSNNFLEAHQTLGFQAKQQKLGYHSYGNKEVSLFGKKPKNTYIAGVIQKKTIKFLFVSHLFAP